MEEQPKFQAGMKVVHENGIIGTIVGDPEYSEYYDNSSGDYFNCYWYKVQHGPFISNIPERELSLADKPETKFKKGDRVKNLFNGKDYIITGISNYDTYDCKDGQNLFCWYYDLKEETGNWYSVAAETDLVDSQTVLQFFYRNHRGDTRVRRAVPESIWFGKSPYYEHEQYFITALDLDKRETRDFAFQNMQIIHTKPTPNNLIAVQYQESMVFSQGERVKAVTPRFAPGDRIMFSVTKYGKDGDPRSLIIHSGVVRFVNVFDFLAQEYIYCVESKNKNRTIYPKVFESQIIANLREYPAR